MFNKITLSGIADEAAKGIQGQIEAHRELGWEHLELRLIDGKNISAELDDQSFRRVAERINASGLRVTGFASAIGNWSRSIEGDFSVDTDELRCAAPRMRELGVRYIRTMSWLQEKASDEYWKSECIRRYRELTRIAAGEGIVLCHENCTGWAGQSGEHMVALLEAVDSPHLTLLFDIGNTVSHGYGPIPFYEAVKSHMGYVHVKDCGRAPQGGRSQDYRYPGEGDACLREIIGDILSSGYEGVISIEPHVAAIVHQGTEQADEQKMYTSYLKYARQWENLLRSIVEK